MDFQTQKEIGSYTFEDLLLEFMDNSDASILSVILNKDGDEQIYAAERYEDKLNFSNINYPSIRPVQSFISSSGNRVYYTAVVSDSVTGDLKGVHINVNHTEIGWSEPQVFNIYDSDGKPIDFTICDIANDGKTLLISTPNNPMMDFTVKKYAIVYEENGKWGLPNYFDYTPQIERSQTRDKFYISESGDVIAVQSLKNIKYDTLYLYDIYLYFRTSSGQWIKQQVNPPDLDALPDIHLTKDGTKLFWLPYESMAMPDTAKMK